MEIILYLAVFAFSCLILYWAGEILINHLIKISKFLGLTEFVVAFFVMALAASLPNLFVGITSALQGVPELSLGDVFGNNMAALTLAVFFAVLFAPKREVKVGGETVQMSIWFTALAAILPLIVLADGVISRSDGVILITAFVLYVLWLVSKSDRFSRVYNHQPQALKMPNFSNLARVLKSLLMVGLGVMMLLLAAQGIVFSAKFFASFLGLSVVLIGFLVVGLGNALPQVYFSFVSARRGETSLILGNIMGSIIFPATLVLGIVALIKPIEVFDQDFLVFSRIFMVVACLMFVWAARSDKKLVLWEAIALVFIYLLFMVTIVWLFAF